MKVNDFIDDLGDVLQEDFVRAPLWTRTQLLGYVRQMLYEMSVKMMLVDRSRINLVNGTTGEFTVPGDFHSGYYLQFNRAFVDLVKYGDLEYASQTWALNSTGTPTAATVFGGGDTATVRMVPVPSTVTGAFGSGTISTLTLADSGGTVWTVTSDGGALVTTVGGASGLSIILRGTTTQWTLGVNTLGQLITTLNVGGTVSTIYLTDTSTSEPIDVYANDSGVVVTKSLAYGIITQLLLGATAQTLTTGTNSTNAEYGVVVDLYATGVSTTPEHVGRLDSPVGEIVVTRTSDYSAELWYKAHFEDVPTVESELWLSTPFLAVLKHGVLALAFGHNGDGQDLVKAKLMRKLFDSECEAIKRMFNKV